GGNGGAGGSGAGGGAYVFTGGTVDLEQGMVSANQVAGGAGGRGGADGGQDGAPGQGVGEGLYVGPGGTLAASGTVQGDVPNAGTLAVGGAAPGVLTIAGDSTQAATGTLSVRIGGLTAGDDYDQLVVTGLAALDGTLDVRLINGFQPQPGD